MGGWWVVDWIQTMGNRRMLELLYTVIFVALCALHGVEAEALSEARCGELGFTGLAPCSYCDSLAEYVKDKGAGTLAFCGEGAR